MLVNSVSLAAAEGPRSVNNSPSSRPVMTVHVPIATTT